MPLVWSGQAVTKAADDLGITDSCRYDWARQDRIDRDEIKGVPRAESREVRKARRRIREREDELPRRANAVLGRAIQHPKDFHPVIDVLVDAGHSVRICCRVLGCLARATTAIGVAPCLRQ